MKILKPCGCLNQNAPFDAMIDGAGFIDLKRFWGYVDAIFAISNHIIV
jgi:hypothetical protein